MLTAPVTRVARAAMEGNKGTITTKPEHQPTGRGRERAKESKKWQQQVWRTAAVPHDRRARKVGRGQI